MPDEWLLSLMLVVVRLAALTVRALATVVMVV